MLSGRGYRGVARLFPRATRGRVRFVRLDLRLRGHWVVSGRPSSSRRFALDSTGSLRECQDSIESASPHSGLSASPPIISSKECEAVKEEVYELRAVVDSHNHHDEPEEGISVTVSNHLEATESSVHVDSLSEEPDWVEEAVQLAEATPSERDVEHFITHMGGREVRINIATNTNEYRANFSRIKERVVE